MITFKQFLNEDQFAHTEMEPDLFVKWCETNASKYLPQIKKSPIFRGMPMSIKMGVFDTNSLNRESANTVNYYTIWMDNNPAWKDYPKRSKSYICSTNNDMAGGFGNVHLIIPADGSEIGIIAGDDLWYGFDYIDRMTGRSMDGFMSDVQDLIMAANKREHLSEYNMAHKNYAALCSCLKRVTFELIDDLNTETGKREEWKKYLQAFKTHGFRTLYDLFENGMDPTKNGFSHVVSGSASFGGHDNEIWVQGKCAFLRFEGLLRRMAQNDALEEFVKEYIPKQWYVKHDPKDYEESDE
jgi:hypothetical protein